ncbi:methanobactin export MATE transporter MbnM [Sandaracinus amylolyticus]|uniref:Methylamine utilization protein mauG n=1 Tax=Sandaracinus amylolyticus TaxID=927083 RepID=A0A0F6SEA1_9BACT|nr:methanobactin export MATE transporter MbnM [Sandaracinus amylolyticus]AKF04834.1 Methylamine utilization protein mauG [Sandaracinus amylolyticus]
MRRTSASRWAIVMCCALGACQPSRGTVDASHGHHDHDHGEIPVEPLDGGPEIDAAAIDAGPQGWVWRLPRGLPVPRVPEDNPMSASKVELGRHLFYDTRLSGNRTQSCASCHEQARAFTDGRAFSIGSTGERTPRSSMTLANVAYATTLTWANPLLLELEAQALVPLFGREPVELGLAGMERELLERLRAEARYRELFPLAFPDESDPFTVANVTRALAAFQRTLVSGRSAYDRFLYGGEPDALSESARRGLALFSSERLECFHCHQGFNFADAVMWEGSGSREVRFHNTGLYNVGGTGAYPEGGTGVHEISGRADDMGRFRAPTLRNIAVTAPYMHDGSIATLDEVIDHYAAGGRTIAEGPYAGVGSASPLKSGLVVGFELTPDERRDLIAFLESLTDESFLTDPALADPWSTSRGE